MPNTAPATHSPVAVTARSDAPRIRVVLAARVRLYREGLQEALDRHQSLEVAAACATVDELLNAASRERPGVVILDISLCGDRPVARELLAAVPTTKILALAVDDRRVEAVLACASAGMAGWVGNEATIEELAEAVEHVARGELLCSARHAALLFGSVADLLTHRPDAPASVALTAREREVGVLLAKGISNKGISRALGIGIATVKNHVHNILTKLDVQSRAEAGARLQESLVRAEAPATEGRQTTTIPR